MDKFCSDGSVLLGNTFSLSLVRRPVRIEPVGLEELKGVLSVRPVRSFWGHSNTVHVANALLGVDVKPRTERPALTLNADGLPVLEGEVFSECYILSPDYRPGFRPAMGAEVYPEDITGWQVLRIEWDSKVVERV
jgi:hypothetical protein